MNACADSSMHVRRHGITHRILEEPHVPFRHGYAAQSEATPANEAIALGWVTVCFPVRECEADGVEGKAAYARVQQDEKHHVLGRGRTHRAHRELHGTATLGTSYPLSIVTPPAIVSTGQLRWLNRSRSRHRATCTGAALERTIANPQCMKNTCTKTNSQKICSLLSRMFAG
jgi:hypothetical protein